MPTLPSSSSWGVSTPWSGTRSPVKLFVCVRGRFTPLMWDIAAGPLCARSFFFAALASALPAAATASSIRREGKSNSCCLSAYRDEGFVQSSQINDTLRNLVLPRDKSYSGLSICIERFLNNNFNNEKSIRAIDAFTVQ